MKLCEFLEMSFMCEVKLCISVLKAPLFDSVAHYRGDADNIPSVLLNYEILHILIAPLCVYISVKDDSEQ